MQLSNFLRAVLKIDGAACLAMAALALPLAEALAEPLGVDSRLLGGSAVSLIPIGLFILWLGTRRHAPAALIWLVIIGNIGWSAASFAAAAELAGITPLGQLLVAGQAVAVLAITFAEWMGLRSSRIDGVNVAQAQG